MLETRLLQRVTAKKTHFDQLLPLPVSLQQKLTAQMTIEWIYNSNAIEGSTITLRDTQLILETGVTIGGKSLREHFEVVNHREAIAYVEQVAQAASLPTTYHVRQIHQLVMSRIDDSSAGQYRTTQGRIVGAQHTPPEAWQVAAEMDDWARWLAENYSVLHPIELAAMAHHRLVAIHPFVDGNGRTARLVMNLILMQLGYPPSVILRTNRRQFYRVLATADRGQMRGLVNFVGRAVERSLTIYLAASLPQAQAPHPADQLRPLAELAPSTPYSQPYLSLLARLGRIEAIKRGRVWHSTENAIQVYLASLNPK